MKIKYLGHATFLIDFNGKQLLFDPFISPNPLAKGVDISAIKPDYILISHGHEDHLADVKTIAAQSGASLISNYEIISWFGQKGLEGHPLNHGGKYTFDFGTVKYVNAVHSSVLPDGTYGGNPGGFVVWNDNQCFYFAGDTALTLDMQLLPKTCPQIDVALLPIGDNFTMGYEDAALAAAFVNCKKVVGCHYNTFPPIAVDTEAAKKHFEASGISLFLPKIGTAVDF